ncbi:MAG: hypothetical protein Ctma_1346 [Catillopecten margaritatus gill symbiont]|uniref:Uncharacterized protein n=1 Tax=Catillopecten margaritatus gill symbiont TaxID=3083288 RepID=A0AAU6PHY6_9GAMM
MKDFSKIPTLSCYADWLIKAETELDRFEETYNIYDATNCLLSLNCLPSWIGNSDSNETMKKLANEKEDVMKFHELDSSNLGNIDNKLRLIRLFCNHAKHSKPKGSFVSIKQGVSIPTKLPAKFEYLFFGKDRVEIIDLCNKVIEFWKKHITRHST